MEVESPLTQLGCDYCPLSAVSHQTHRHTRAQVKRQTERREVESRAGGSGSCGVLPSSALGAAAAAAVTERA